MVKRTLVSFLVILSIIAGFTASFMAGVLVFDTDPVFASGNATFTANITSNNYQRVMDGQDSVAQYWSQEVTQSTYDETHNGMQCGIWGTSQTDKYFDLKRGIVGFDISAFPEGVDVLGARIYMKSNVEQQNADYNPYYAFYKMYNGDNVINAGDFDEAYNFAGAGVSDRATVGYYQDSIVGNTWYEFTVLESDLEWISEPDANGMVWLQFASMHDMTNAQPVPWKQYGITFWTWKDFNTSDDIRLEIDYVQGTPEREIIYDPNDPFTGNVTGSETTDNITWGSPRAGYADEGVLLQLNGDAGAYLDLDLVDNTGTVLKEQTGQIGDSGQWDFYYKLPDDYYGFVRLFENNSGVVSEWGYQMPEPDADQQSGLVYAVNTDYPQYNFLFSNYVKYENGVGALHWKTNVQAGEEADHSLDIWGNGDNVTQEHFNQTLEWLNDNYWHANADNKYLSAWRYFIFTPNVEGSGFNDYDGMIYDLDVDYSSLSAGFLQAVIYDDVGDSVLADSHSCYWYIPTVQDGFVFNLNKSNYKLGEDISIKLNIGQACRVKTYLPSLTIQMIDDTETVLTSYSGGFEYGLNQYVVEAPTLAGTYEIRFIFSGDPSWSYIHDEYFTVAGQQGTSPTGGIIDNVINWIENQGMDTTIGWWVLLLLGMVILFLLAYESKLLRVALPLVYLGLFIVWGKVDTVLIILLALGAGLTLYRLFKGHVGHGGNDSEG